MPVHPSARGTIIDQFYQGQKLDKSVVSTTGVYGNFVVHDIPREEVSGCPSSSVPVAPEIEIIEPGQAPDIEQAQGPMKRAWQGVASTKEGSQGAAAAWSAFE